MFTEGGRASSNVHGDVEDSSPHNPDQLVLGCRRNLEMQSAKRDRRLELSELADAPRGLVRASIGFRLRAVDLWAAPTVD